MWFCFKSNNLQVIEAKIPPEVHQLDIYCSLPLPRGLEVQGQIPNLFSRKHLQSILKCQGTLLNLTVTQTFPLLRCRFIPLGLHYFNKYPKAIFVLEHNRYVQHFRNELITYIDLHIHLMFIVFQKN